MGDDALFAVICMIYGVIGGMALAALYGVVTLIENVFKRKRIGARNDKD